MQHALFLGVTFSMIYSTSITLARQDSAYAFFVLPPLGGTDSYGWGLSETGDVVGSAFLPGNGEFHPTMWINEEVIDLGTLGGPAGRAEGVNASRWAVGWVVSAGGEPFNNRAVLWRDGMAFDLGTLGGDTAHALAINELGEIAGYSYVDSGSSRIRAFKWRNGVMENLGGFDPEGSSFADDINDIGQIVGRAWRSEISCYRAALWEDGNIIDLGTIAQDNGGSSEAYAINQTGRIVGSSQSASFHYHATLWYNSDKYDLGTPRGTRESYALGINNIGQIVGNAYSSAHQAFGFLWDQMQGIQRLDDLMPPENALYPRLAENINDLGQITGTASPRHAPESRDLAFLMSPVHPTMELSIPTPGTAGASNTLTVTNVTPGKKVYFLYSLHGGGTRIPGCDLQQNAVQLDNPTVIGTAIADANGEASITRNVPLVARGQYVLFQAVVQNECAISQLVVHQFE